MSRSDRNIRSTRDRTEERQPLNKIRKHNAWSGIERRSSSHHAWSDDFEENRSNRYVQKDERTKLDRQRSPGFDRWGCENKSRSPSDSWDLPQRGKRMSRDRSRSWSRGEGRGRSRSRSRSRGRPRDRSRSPSNVHKRVSYGMIDRRSGTGMSSQPCKYFSAGMCKKGSQCNFFHPDNLSSRDEKYLEDDLADRRRGRLAYGDLEFGDNEELTDNPHHGGSGDNYEIGNRNVSAKFDHRRQPIRSGKHPCKDFMMGKCHRDNCRYFHDDLSAADKWGDDRRARNHDEKTKSWNAVAWEDVEKNSDTAKSSGWGEKLHDPMVGEKRGDDRRGRNLLERTKSWNGSTWNDVKDTSNTAKSTGWGEGSAMNPKFQNPTAAGNQGGDRWHLNSDEKAKLWNGPTWNDAKDTSNAAKSTGWGEGSVGNTKINDPMVAETQDDDRQGCNLDERTILWNRPTRNDIKETLDASKSVGWGEGSIGDLKLHDPTEKCTDDRQGRNFDEKTKSLNGRTLDDVKGTPDAAKSTGSGEKCTVDMLGRNFDEKTKSWNAPLDDVKVSLDTAKSSGWCDGSVGILTFHNPTTAEERGPHSENASQMWAILKDKAAKRDEHGHVSLHRDPQIIPESSQSQIHEISMHVDEQNLTQETVTLTQVSENSHTTAITEDFNALNKVKVSDQNGERTSQPLPTSTINDHSHQGANLTASNGNNIDLNVPLQNMNPENEAAILLKESVKPSMEILDIGAPPEVLANVVNPKVSGTIDRKQERENIIHGKVEETNNISKEEKAMRLFRIALVELVKEILKPKWKEGQMSREVHKTIVKKTVDKVTSAIPGDQIPNTQEKVDQYLSFSKGKITKLVQAYVERFQKT
ncbi:hypothetical protein LguiB_017688 [Lonicera macranthoides]